MSLSDSDKAWVRQQIANVIRFAQVSASTESGDGDAVYGHETTDKEAGGGYQIQTRRLWPFGIRSRPPVDIDGVVVHAFGGSSNGILVGAESPEYGPDDLAEGEVAIYAKASGTVIKIDKDGAITIVSKDGQPVAIEAGAGAAVTIDAGTGADVKINGGVNNVARASVDTAGPYPISGGALFFKA